MKVINFGADKAQVNLTQVELLVLNAALNEVCNGIDIFEFETRIGSDKNSVLDFLNEVGNLLDKMDGRE
ncbi:hypothetical protein [Pseudomonas viridiflava]|uniref:hypothetical protein n=1 Tax=Pseudomonas viridiflava TaxID=33069 RepID=UPI000F0663D3|nr:hypothetical protein [Pseudomonas viridiflava]